MDWLSERNDSCTSVKVPHHLAFLCSGRKAYRKFVCIFTTICLVQKNKMNRKTYLIAAVCMMALSGCTQKTELPENPRDKEEYRDSQGNQWIYNAMLMRWALMPSIANGLSTTHYYYPGSGTWRNAQGATVDAPSGVKMSTPSAKTKGSVFGSTGRSRSIYA